MKITKAIDGKVQCRHTGRIKDGTILMTCLLMDEENNGHQITAQQGITQQITPVWRIYPLIKAYYIRGSDEYIKSEFDNICSKLEKIAANGGIIAFESNPMKPCLF